MWYYLDKTLSSLVTLLSHSLQTVITYNDVTPKTFNSDDTEWASEPITHEENIRNASFPSKGCKSKACRGVCIKGQRSVSTRQAAQLVGDILETASHLMLVRGKQTQSCLYLLRCYLSDCYQIFLSSPQKYILFHKAQEHRVSTGLLTLFTAYLNQTSTTISSDSTAVYMPASLIQRLFVHHSREPESRPHPPCLLGVLTRLTHSPHTWARHPGKVRMMWCGCAWWWNDKSIALGFLCWFPDEWTCGRPESVRVQREEKDPRSLPHSANKHWVATTTGTRMFCFALQQVDSGCNESPHF